MIVRLQSVVLRFLFIGLFVLAVGHESSSQGKGRIFTDDDLLRYAAPPTATPVPSSGKVPAAPTEPGQPKSSGPQDNRDERGYWCNRATELNNEKDAAQESVKKAEEELRLADNVILYEKRIDEVTLDRQQKARGMLERANRGLEQAQRRFQALDDEARQKSIPPGWLECR